MATQEARKNIDKLEKLSEEATRRIEKAELSQLDIYADYIHMLRGRRLFKALKGIQSRF